MEIADVVAALTAIGVLPVITLGAMVAVGSFLYKRFRA